MTRNLPAMAGCNICPGCMTKHVEDYTVVQPNGREVSGYCFYCWRDALDRCEAERILRERGEE